MMKPIVFLDIDGTLLNTQHKVSTKTKQCIKSATHKGIPIILSSARSPSGVSNIAKSCEISAPTICYNGAIVLDQRGDSIINHSIAISDVRVICKYIGSFYKGIVINIYSGDKWIVEGVRNAYIEAEYSITKHRPFIVSSLLEFLPDQDTVNKILCIGDASDLLCIQRKICACFPHITAVMSKENYLEMTSINASKECAMRLLADMYNVPLCNTIAIGDNYSDLGMIRTAGIGVAMMNSPEDVKKQANFITKSNDDDGVEFVLQKVLNLYGDYETLLREMNKCICDL